MKQFFLLSSFLLAATICFAGDGDYAVSKISAELTKNADAVLRMEDLKTASAFFVSSAEIFDTA